VKTFNRSAVEFYTKMQRGNNVSGWIKIASKKMEIYCGSRGIRLVGRQIK
jgi:hypothetical protein